MADSDETSIYVVLLTFSHSPVAILTDCLSFTTVAVYVGSSALVGSRREKIEPQKFNWKQTGRKRAKKIFALKPSLRDVNRPTFTCDLVLFWPGCNCAPTPSRYQLTAKFQFSTQSEQNGSKSTLQQSCALRVKNVNSVGLDSDHSDSPQNFQLAARREIVFGQNPDCKKPELLWFAHIRR